MLRTFLGMSVGLIGETFLGLLAMACIAQAEPPTVLPDSYYGYYVYASDVNDGSRCKRDELTPTEEVERRPENSDDHIGFILKVTSKELNYNGIGTHVSCKIEKVYRPENRNKHTSYADKYVGPWLRPFDPVYTVELNCFDEGERSRFREMLRLIRLGSKTRLLETNPSLVTDAWAKCER